MREVRAVRRVYPLPKPTPLARLGKAVLRTLGLKAIAGGVTFVGPDTARIVSLTSDTSPQPDASDLTRAIAFVTSAYCYSAMRWRASRLAEPPLMVVRETPGGEDWQPAHRLARLFDLPRPDLEMAELLERTLLYWDHTGAALWVVDETAAGDAAVLTPFSQDEFTSETVGSLVYGRYKVLTSAGTWKEVDRARVIHFREANPLSWRTSPSKVDVALTLLDLGHQVTHTVRRYMRRAILPGGIISPDKDWHPDQDEWNLWLESIEAWHGGPANAGAPLGLQGGTTFSRTATGLSDLLPDEVMDRVEATVGSVFGVPPVVLGWLTGLRNSPWSQMAEARKAAYEDTIVPLWRDFERRLGRALLTAEERAAGYLVRFDTRQVVALRADEEAEARISALNADTWTVNERRRKTGQSALPEDDDRGEEIVGLVKVQSAGLGAIGLGDTGTIDAKEMDSRDLAWLVFDLETKAAEPGWERAVYAYLQDLRSRVRKLADETLEDEPKAAPPKPGPTGPGVDRASARAFRERVEELLARERARIAELSYPLIIRTGGDALKRIMARFNFSFAVVEPGLRRYARERGAFLAEAMGETTGRAVADAVQAGLDAGETVRGLTQRLEALPAFNRERAKLVARSETTAAWNTSQRRGMSDVAQSTGRKAEKSWLGSRDNRECEECMALDDGAWIDIDAVFANGMTEPDHPKGRCTLLYRLGDAPETEGGG